MAVLSGPYNYVIITPEKGEVCVTCGNISLSEAEHSLQIEFVYSLE